MKPLMKKTVTTKEEEIGKVVLGKNFNLNLNLTLNVLLFLCFFTVL